MGQIKILIKVLQGWMNGDRYDHRPPRPTWIHGWSKSSTCVAVFACKHHMCSSKANNIIVYKCMYQIKPIGTHNVLRWIKLWMWCASSHLYFSTVCFDISRPSKKRKAIAKARLRLVLKQIILDQVSFQVKSNSSSCWKCFIQTYFSDVWLIHLVLWPKWSIMGT